MQHATLDPWPLQLSYCSAAFLALQVEFYFSDASLPSDKKLLKQIRKDPEGYGEAKHTPIPSSQHTVTKQLQCSVLVPTGPY